MRITARDPYLHQVDVIQILDKGGQTPDGSIHSCGILALVDDSDQLTQQLRPLVRDIPLCNP